MVAATAPSGLPIAQFEASQMENFRPGMGLGSGAFLLGMEQGLGYLSVDGVGGLGGILGSCGVKIEFCKLVEGFVFLHVFVGFPDKVSDERRVTVDRAM